MGMGIIGCIGIGCMTGAIIGIGMAIIGTATKFP